MTIKPEAQAERSPYPLRIRASSSRMIHAASEVAHPGKEGVWEVVSACGVVATYRGGRVMQMAARPTCAVCLRKLAIASERELGA